MASTDRTRQSFDAFQIRRGVVHKKGCYYYGLNKSPDLQVKKGWEQEGTVTRRSIIIFLNAVNVIFNLISKLPSRFFLMGHVKNIVYNRPIHNEEDLRNRLQEAFGTITPEIVRASKLNLLRRAQLCLEMNGRNFQHLL
jgi:hypothetical protein